MADPHKQAKSRYTSDRGMPGAFEGETVTRRAFMNISAQAAGGIAAAAFTLPALGFALGPLFSREPFQWQTVGTVDDFNETQYVTKVITIVEGIGEAGKTIAYMRKRNEAIDGHNSDPMVQFIALSSRCMHLGCPVRYVQAAERFICPCHGGVYNFKGMVAGGPPVRPLDRFYTRTITDPAGGPDLVQVGPRFSVNSELQRFSPRDPGEPLDGIGQFLYPKRFSTSIMPKS